MDTHDELVAELNKVLDLPRQPRPAAPRRPAEDATPGEGGGTDTHDERAARALFGDRKVIDLPRPAPPGPPAEDAPHREGGESQAEDLGPCAARPSSKWVPAVHVFRRRGGPRTFQYAHMGYMEFAPDGLDGFVIEFNEPEKWRLTVEGRNLWPIYNYLAQQRVEWIKLADRDFAGDGEAVILAVTIEPVREEG
jgi:hypothetical protein